MTMRIKEFEVTQAKDIKIALASLNKIEENSVIFYFIKSSEKSKYFDMRIFHNAKDIRNEFIKTLIVSNT
jgi:hypothetical protein